MTLLPFECEWEKNHVVVYQTDGKEKFSRGIYNVIPKQICEKCGNPYRLENKGKLECHELYLHSQILDVDRIFQLGRYYQKYSLVEKDENDVLSRDILALKHDPDYAVPLAKAMFLTIKENFPILLSADAIVPVPNHENDSDYNAKAEALALELGNEFHKNNKEIEVIHALRKIVDTSITSLGKVGREIAVKNMFEINPKYSVSKKKLLLVDDILTVGHIKGKCATILKNNGAEKIWVYVAGRTLR